jgi:hypothetical protein
VTGSCEYDNGPSDFSTGEECGDQLKNCKLLDDSLYHVVC